MTTETIPTPAPAVDTSKPPRGKDVVTKREGINAWGLYVEILHYYAATRKLAVQRRLLVAENTYSESLRRAGMKQARWTAHTYPDHDQAMRAFYDRINTLFAGNKIETPHTLVELRHDPVLVQLTEVDVEQLRRGEAPGGRYSAIHHVDMRLGKLDDDAYQGGAGVAVPLTGSVAAAAVASTPGPSSLPATPEPPAPVAEGDAYPTIAEALDKTLPTTVFLPPVIDPDPPKATLIDGTPVEIGMKVRSVKDGMTGTVIGFLAHRPGNIKILRDDTGKATFRHAGMFRQIKPTPTVATYVDRP